MYELLNESVCKTSGCAVSAVAWQPLGPGKKRPVPYCHKHCTVPKHEVIGTFLWGREIQNLVW